MGISQTMEGHAATITERDKLRPKVGFYAHPKFAGKPLKSNTWVYVANKAYRPLNTWYINRPHLGTKNAAFFGRPSKLWFESAVYQMARIQSKGTAVIYHEITASQHTNLESRSTVVDQLIDGLLRCLDVKYDSPDRQRTITELVAMIVRDSAQIVVILTGIHLNSELEPGLMEFLFVLLRSDHFRVLLHGTREALPKDATYDVSCNIHRLAKDTKKLILE
jgi:hypothetical protein